MLPPSNEHLEISLQNGLESVVKCLEIHKNGNIQIVRTHLSKDRLLQRHHKERKLQINICYE